MSHFLSKAAAELEVETKVLLPDALAELENMEWPGNVRQLENMARWLTVMASSHEIHLEDLPSEARNSGGDEGGDAIRDWRRSLRSWAVRRLQKGQQNLLQEATPAFESIMIEAALERTGGRRQEAAKLLGWGRNTLTRKIKELDLEE
jgi:two-component system, NtrC family, nitrogen regulation response regulator GlnG